MHAKIKDNTLILFPYTHHSLVLDNPNTRYDDRYDLLGWFNQTETHLLEGYTLEEVVEGDIPVIDLAVEYNQTAVQPTLVDGVWTLVTTTVPRTQEEIDSIASVMASLV
jgi:hypothetical protein